MLNFRELFIYPKVYTVGSYGLILLAAGPSNRMGQPKQLLLYQGKTLLERMLQAASGSVYEQVIVVLGAYSESMEKLIDPSKATIVQNNNWEEGIASSIRSGLTALIAGPNHIDAAVFIVCDQPFVSTALLNKLAQKMEETGTKIIASAYGGTVGTPALFDKSFFPALLKLQGHDGAKKIIMEERENMGTVSFPMGDFDIDTLADYERLAARNKN